MFSGTELVYGGFFPSQLELTKYMVHRKLSSKSFSTVRKLFRPLDNNTSLAVLMYTGKNLAMGVAARYKTYRCIRDLHKDTGPLTTTVAQMLGATRFGGAVGCLAAAASLWTATKRQGASWRQADVEELPSRELNRAKHVVVIGAGVAGVSSAYQLAKRG